MVESYRKMKLAIIGASSGQLPICLKAKEMGLQVHCFAWPEGAVCKDVVDFFHPVSIVDKDEIVAMCRELNIDGVVSNASELTAEIAAYISEKLGLNGTPYNVLAQLHDKFFVRQLSEKVSGLSKIKFYEYKGRDLNIYPCVVKPSEGSAKSGVSFVSNKEDFEKAVHYAGESTDGKIIVEEFITGKELSIESISFKGKHQVIQITDKDSSSAPHFVELGHHQPAAISDNLREKIEITIPQLLEEIGYTNGASHIEVKYSGEELYLIEANLRGGGDEISNKLVQMSSGVDYLRCMIEVALGVYRSPVIISEPSFAGIYYLCKQTEDYLPFFEQADGKSWFVEGEIRNRDLKESLSNYERDGYLIYKSDQKINIK
jgi:biotin carboxylase